MIACPACNAATLIQLPDPAPDAQEWYCLECGQAVLVAHGQDQQPLDTLAWRPPQRPEQGRPAGRSGRR